MSAEYIFMKDLRRSNAGTSLLSRRCDSMTSRLIKIFDPPNDRIPQNLLKNVESDRRCVTVSAQTGSHCDGRIRNEVLTSERSKIEPQSSKRVKIMRASWS